MIPLTAFSRDAIQVLQDEFMRAQKKHPGKTPAEPGIGNGERLPILGEEFGEVCTALTYDRGNSAELEKELIQLSTMALAWWMGLQEEKRLVRDDSLEQFNVAQEILMDEPTELPDYAKGDSVLIFKRIRMDRHANGTWYPYDQFSRLEPRSDRDIDELIGIGDATIIKPQISIFED